MNSNPVAKNYVAMGIKAHQDMHEYLESPVSDFSKHDEIFSEEASRARHLLHHDGEMGHASFKAGDTLIGPVEDQALTRMMERKIEGEK